MIRFICNNGNIETVSGKTGVLLDFLRNEVRLKGTKEGCREGDCGACTILIGKLTDKGLQYKTVNSCLFPLGAAGGCHVVTIEGLNMKKLSPVQQMIVDEGASQCGFCTPGFIVSLTGYLLSAEKLTNEEALEFIAGNICRCTGYESIKRAVINLVKKANETLNGNNAGARIPLLIEAGFIPEYFSAIEDRLKLLKAFALPDEVFEKPQFLISGGTDLYVQKWEQAVEKGGNFINSYKIPDEIILAGNRCVIGGAAAINSVKESEIIKKHIPRLSDSLEYFGSMQIRNRGTVGGNIVNASPIGDFANILLAFNAILTLVKNGFKREVLLKDFYKGYKTLALKEGELLESAAIELPSEKTFFNYEKVSRRTYLDIASVNTTALIDTDENIITEVNISAGGVAPFPLYLAGTCNYLKGKEIENSIIRGGIEIALTEISPISDARGSAEYKALLLSRLLCAHFMKLAPGKITAEALK